MKQIPLSQGLFALVDDEDFEYLNQFKWCALKAPKTFYAIRRANNSKNPTIYMHRIILGLTDSKIHCDHRDNNGLNNQKYNLRPCTNSQNQKNKSYSTNGTSKYKGVSKIKNCATWIVRIYVNGKNISFTGFRCEIEAAKKYDEMAKLYYGEFAWLNFKE